MRILQDKSGSDGYFNSEFTYGDSGEASWDYFVQTNNFKEKRRLVNKIIELANSKMPLEETFRKYHIEFGIKYSSSGWTNVCSCPFKDHNDSSPSFGYNSEQDRFYCFGCHRAGRSVQFISYMEDKPSIEVAKEILTNKNELYNEIIQSKYISVDHEKLTNILVNYADCVKEFRHKYKNNIIAQKYADDVSWPLDLYIDKVALNNSINLDQLTVMTRLLKEQLGLFDDE